MTERTRFENEEKEKRDGERRKVKEMGRETGRKKNKGRGRKWRRK